MRIAQVLHQFNILQQAALQPPQPLMELVRVLEHAELATLLGTLSSKHLYEEGNMMKEEKHVWTEFCEKLEQDPMLKQFAPGGAQHTPLSRGWKEGTHKINHKGKRVVVPSLYKRYQTTVRQKHDKQ